MMAKGNSMKLLIKQIALQKGLRTPQDLSHTARITHATASKVWTDAEQDVDIRLSTLQRIAQALGVGVRDLIAEDALEEKTGA
jgi:DNA-binding Xre family transcriptional regulator